MIHNLKLAQGFLDAIVDGDKTFYVRFGDRPYQRGDTLWLIEVKPRATGLLSYFADASALLDVTGRVVIAEVSYVLTRESMQAACGESGLRKGFVVLGLTAVRTPEVVDLNDLRRAVGLRVPRTDGGGTITAAGGWVAPSVTYVGEEQERLDAAERESRIAGPGVVAFERDIDNPNWTPSQTNGL